MANRMNERTTNILELLVDDDPVHVEHAELLHVYAPSVLE